MKIIKDKSVTIKVFYAQLQNIFYSKNFKTKRKFFLLFYRKSKNLE